ncbi:MAG: MFS transporter, partial [Acidimicrobiia bacterium]
MVAESDRSLPRRLFFALGIRNYRLYFIGQLVSVSGTWMQRVAQAWLVLSLTGSGTAVGGLTALQFLPILVLAPLGGVIADRVDKRRLLYVTQSLAGAIAATLGLLIVTDRVELWMVYAMAFALGLVACVDNPARQAFIIEMVGRDRLTNAVSLNSVLVNAARVFGPALGGVLIVTVGIGTCFLINAASYLALITALVVMRDAEMVKAEPSPRGRGQVRQGLRYAARTPRLIVPLVMLAVIGIFSYEYSVILPLLARFTFGGDANTFGIMFTAIGIGAVAGGLKTGARTEYRAATLSLLAGALGIALGVVAVAPNLW